MEALFSIENNKDTAMYCFRKVVVKKRNIMRDVLNKTKFQIRFLFCPRCGLRKPADEIFGYFGGHCPSCGCRMLEEGSIPYTLKKSKYIIRQHPV
jgi:hypothetical protein